MNKMLAYPEEQQFDSKQFDQLMKQLRAADQYTIRKTISSPKDVQLGPGGRLVDGDFRLSPLALRQLCTQIANGLWPLVADIAGIHITERSYDQAVSVPLAARLVNDCLNLRFKAVDGLIGRDMIQDHDARIVDGIVGPRYQFLPNCELLELLEDLLSTHDVPMRFHSAKLVGRRLEVVYLADKVLAKCDDGDIRGGVYFINSEAGECSVRGATILQIGHTMRAMNELRRLKHSGKDFIKRLQRMLMDVLLTWDRTVEVAKAMHIRMDVPVHLVTKTVDDGLVIWKAARQKLKGRFAEYVDRPVASDIVRKVIYMGADGTHVPRTTPIEEIAKRRVRDAVIVAMKSAYGQYPKISEGLSRLAFDILSGKVML